MDDETYNRWSLRVTFAAAAVTLGGIGTAIASTIIAPAIEPVAAAVAMAGVTVAAETFLHGVYRILSTGTEGADKWSLRAVFGAAATGFAGWGAFAVGTFAAPAIVPSATAVALDSLLVEAGAALYALGRSTSKTRPSV